MSARYPDPAVEAELAYRRQLLQASAQRSPARRNSWLTRRRRSH